MDPRQQRKECTGKQFLDKLNEEHVRYEGDGMALLSMSTSINSALLDKLIKVYHAAQKRNELFHALPDTHPVTKVDFQLDDTVRALETLNIPKPEWMP